MRSRTKVIAAALVTAALAAGSAGAAVASTAGTKPGASATTVSAGEKRAGNSGPSGQPGGSKAASAKAVPQPGTDAFTAAVAAELQVSTARADTALRPLLTAGTVDSSSREFAAVASSLGVTPQQLVAALAQAKQSLAGGQ
jgi:hypothetical protein